MKTEIIKIEGMACSHCTGAVTDGISKMSGVSSVDVSLENKSATVTYDEEKVTIAEIGNVVEELGFEVVD